MELNDVCRIEPALIVIYDFEVGTGLIVRDELGIRIVDTPTGRQIPVDNLYVPPNFVQIRDHSQQRRINMRRR